VSGSLADYAEERAKIGQACRDCFKSIVVDLLQSPSRRVGPIADLVMGTQMPFAGN